MGTENLEDGLLRPAQAAKLLGVAENTLRVWHCEGKNYIQAIKLPGGHRRYYKSSILEYLRSHQESPSAPAS